MEIKCVNCGRRVNLDHAVFVNYVGTVKCFCCCSLMEVKIKDRVLHGASLLSPKKHFPRVEQKVESSSSGKGITEWLIECTHPSTGDPASTEESSPMRLIFQRDEKERIAESLMTQGNTGLEHLQGPVHTKTAMLIIGTCKNRSSDSIAEE